MCNDKEHKSTAIPTKSVASATRRRGVERGSWHHFLTNSFHGMLGMTSFSVTLLAWIHNECVADDDVRSSSSFVLSMMSLILITILSIHSSWYMLEQSPQQSTILDYKLKLQPNSGKITSAAANTKEINIKVVAPHRGAFHRTSIIMQYANARILMLLQRRHWHQEEMASSALAPAVSKSTSVLFSSVIVWGLVSLMCLRMLPIPGVSRLFRRSSKGQTVKSSTVDETSRKLPRFWANGNSYCFVLPMVISVVADFLMAVWCEYHYYNVYSKSQQNELSLSPSHSLFRYHSLHWLSLWHLFFLQIVAHVIAFSFTLAFRIKSNNRNRKSTGGARKNASASTNGVASFFQSVGGVQFVNIRTLYWLCTIGVYVLVIIGFNKATATLKALRM